MCNAWWCYVGISAVVVVILYGFIRALDWIGKAESDPIEEISRGPEDV